VIALGDLSLLYIYEKHAIDDGLGFVILSVKS